MAFPLNSCIRFLLPFLLISSHSPFYFSYTSVHADPLSPYQTITFRLNFCLLCPISHSCIYVPPRIPTLSHCTPFHFYFLGLVSQLTCDRFTCAIISVRIYYPLSSTDESEQRCSSKRRLSTLIEPCKSVLIETLTEEE